MLMEQMTERERVLAVLQGKEPDRLPWLADLSYYLYGLEMDGKYPEAYRDTQFDNGLQALHKDWGVGFYLQGFQPYITKSPGVTQRTEKKGDSVLNILETPVGTLREVSQYSASSYSVGVTEHLIKDITDLKTYLWICQHREYEASYEFAKARYQTIGDNGVVLCYTPKSPLMDLVALYAGVENLTYMQMDEEEELTAILSELESLYEVPCRLTLESPAECIMIPENISSECVAGFYKPYMKHYHQRWTKEIRAAGKYSFVHLDGTVKGLISALSKESGFDVIEAVTPLPVGDVEIDVVQGMVAPNTIIWGGIPGGLFHPASCTDEAFDRHVMHCIETMVTQGRFVLGVADQVVPGSSPERIKRVRTLVNQYGNKRG